LGQAQQKNIPISKYFDQKIVFFIRISQCQWVTLYLKLFLNCFDIAIYLLLLFVVKVQTNQLIIPISKYFDQKIVFFHQNFSMSVGDPVFEVIS